MKAIVCPQCGGLIKKVSEEKQMAECSYCGARIFIERAGEPQKASIPRRDTRVPLEDYKPLDDYEPITNTGETTPWDDISQNESLNRVLGIVAGAGTLLFIFAIFAIVATSKKPAEPLDEPVTRRRTPTPEPYRREVPTVTNSDAITLPKPDIPRGLRIRKAARIEVYVSVDDRGNIYDANAYEGPEALQKIAVQAAKKAKFKARTDKSYSSGSLIYDFGPQ
jgi:hypothetical protein